VVHSRGALRHVESSIRSLSFETVTESRFHSFMLVTLMEILLTEQIDLFGVCSNHLSAGTPTVISEKFGAFPGQ
jgi:hypothetical protein